MNLDEGYGEEHGDRQRWGARVRALLDAAGPAAARQVQRGQALARRGAVEDLLLVPGEVRGSIMEDRGPAVMVTIGWPVTDDAVWETAAAALSRTLRPTASLLDGWLDRHLVAALDSVGVTVLPPLAELTPTCSCEDPASWCRHAAAVLTLAAVQVDRRPTLLLTLRGRTREALLGAMRRSDASATSTEHTLDPADGMTAARGDLDAIALHPSAARDPGALLRQLGPPPGVVDEEPLFALVARASATAWQLAAGDGAAAADEAALLAELRAQRVATAAALAGSLGQPDELVREVLEELYHRGEVLRMGQGERARYRAASG